MGNEREADGTAEIVREYGPFPGAPHVHGVSFYGSLVWFATGERLQALEPESGEVVRGLDVACDAGTASSDVAIGFRPRARPRASGTAPRRASPP